MALTLFIGGCADAQRIEIEPEREHVSVLRPLPPFSLSDDYKVPEKFEIEYDTYRRERIYGRKETFEVMLWNKLDADDLIEMLLENY